MPSAKTSYWADSKSYMRDLTRATSSAGFFTELTKLKEQAVPATRHIEERAVPATRHIEGPMR